jgi:Xaa-Pro aminopeptidase
MIYNNQLPDGKCALCGKALGKSSNNNIFEETIESTHYKFDTKDCAAMFKRFLAVYGNDFKHFLGQEQYISDPFWDRVIPKEEEIKEIKKQEANEGQVRTEAKRTETIKIIKDPIEIQKLRNELIKSAKEEIEITFSDANIFHQYQASGSFQLLKEAAAKH